MSNVSLSNVAFMQLNGDPMRKMMLTITLLLTSITTLGAEIKLPQASPAVLLSHKVGVSEVKISYHRPAVKGRTIWGGLVPFDKVWRLGANEATTIEFSHPARIAGKEIPAGRYGLFAIPSAGEWTFVLNRKADQWGSFFYKQEDDVLRFKSKPQPSEFREWLEFTAQPEGDNALTISAAWEKLRVPFRVEFDTESLVWKQADAALASPDANWETYHQAARYALATGKRLDEAARWVEKAMKTESFWNYELKALLLQKQGKLEQALPLMHKAIETAKDKAPQEYIDGLQKVIAGWIKPAAGK